MVFKTFAQYLQTLEETPSRIEMTKQLANLFVALDPSELAVASYLLQGSLVPPYQSMEFQLSSKMLIKALARVKNSKVQQQQDLSLFGDMNTLSAEGQVTQEYKKLGDLGLVAQQWVTSADTQLSITDVYHTLWKVAAVGGAGSQEQKVLGVAQLLDELDSLSAKFVVRIILGKLRLGFSVMTLLDALSWAVTGGKEHHTLLEDAYQKKADVGVLAAVYLADPEASKRDPEAVLSKYSVTVGVPVVPALCNRLNTSKEIIDKMGEVLAEPKYDGLRVQIHFSREGFPDNPSQKIRAFTRNLENVSNMFPELLTLENYVTASQLVLDSEAIGYDVTSGKLLPFQETITRKRKHDIAEAAQQVPMRFYIFDVLFRDSVGYLQKPLHERKGVLEDVISENSTFILAPVLRTSDPIALRQYHEELLAEGLEGAVIKKVDSHYQSGRKGWNWVKIKEEEGTSGKLKDTLDVVIMGYYFGRGKRSQFGIGALLAGVLGSDNTVQTIAKIGTGLSEQQLAEFKVQCDELAVLEKPKTYQVHEMLVPDVWVSPSMVIEVAADEITKSPTHTAGVALRFPRLISRRVDKSWEDATTVEELASL